MALHDGNPNTSNSVLDNLPIRVLLHDHPGTKAVKVTAIRPNLFPRRTHASDRLSRNPDITGGAVRFLAVMDIRHPLESSGQPFSHSGLPDKARTPGS